MLVYLLLPASYVSAAGMMVPLGHDAALTASLATWMAIWWMTEAISVYATALLPLVVLPVGGTVSMRATASAYANELIFLFMGGFILALGMQRWGLHRRIALTALRIVGTRPRTLVGGFMATTAILSMWVSNTATALMMLPIATSLTDLLVDEKAETSGNGHRMALCLMLGIAYAASIGGLGTIIGSPPNVFVVSYMQREMGMEVSFLKWMFVGVPLVAVFLPLTWFLLTFVLQPIGNVAIKGDGTQLREDYHELGSMKPGEWIVFLTFCATATLWIMRPLLARVQWGGIQPFSGLTDAGIAMTAAIALFVMPVDRKASAFAMNWEWAAKLPWGLLILFGGGLSLAAAIDDTGVGPFLGAQVQSMVGLPSWMLVVLVTGAVIFLTELTSNTATTAALVPILAAVAAGLDVPAVALVIPAALAASCAFMLPVATPPNAIVFGTGRVTIPEMAKAGMLLNLLGIVLITITVYALILPLFGS